VSTTRRGARRGASPARIESRGQVLEQSPLPAGTRIRDACTCVAIVHRRSASGGGRPIPPDTRHLDTRGVSMPPPIGHRPGPTQPNMAWRGAARSARNQGERDQLGSPRGGLAHRHYPEEGSVAFVPCCSTKCDNTPSQPHPVGGKASQAVSPGIPVGEYPPRKDTPKSTHARRRPGEDAPSDKHEFCDRTFTCPRRRPRGNTRASRSHPIHSPSVPLRPSENPPQTPSKDPQNLPSGPMGPESAEDGRSFGHRLELRRGEGAT